MLMKFGGNTLRKIWQILTFFSQNMGLSTHYNVLTFLEINLLRIYLPCKLICPTILYFIVTKIN